MCNCSTCKRLKKHPTAAGFTCVVYEHFPSMVIYIPGINELGCDFYEPKGEEEK